ncbi:MAG: hypothetical protein IKS51_01640 [Erysipelotrichaceae bacterium]|nr:hypothetical protein [Erysipelotrichaceae bacterium]
MKQISLRLDETQYNDLKDLGEIFHIDYSQIIREGIDLAISRMKKDPWYMVQKMMEETPVMDKNEEEEILNELNSLDEEDLKIVETRTRKL